MVSGKIGLSPSIKQLLTLRNPHPLPAPSFTQLSRILTRTFNDAKDRKAETGWLVLATCSLLTANRPATLGHLYRFLTGNRTENNNDPARILSGEGLAEAVNRATLIRESALKSTIFVGVPRVILSLAALHDVLDENVKAAMRTNSRRTPSPETVEETLTRGRKLWRSIYAPHDEKLHDKLGSYHPDFIAFIIQSYGSVLAPLPGETRNFYDSSSFDDPHQGNLSRALGSVVGIACLRAEGRVIPQLTSHVFGLLKARLLEDQSAEDVWLSSDEGTEWVIRSVDHILDGLESSESEKAKL
ncbi:hypothetical protein DL96DRAFT_1666954 [Flagelloscypha sp. PMI_526]|nr:hypothetical protein DL96DRAFT_1666954 [Flagelloscypha sp. PMI_526]